ncbi:MAG: multidrug efflux SMR transporter [Selenomonadaceae bacterium]|nr:multidrug efflux SMR transporter [Selenomonadaceae bacterium]
MHWIFLIIAGCFETFWAIALKLSEGFSRPAPTILTIVGMIISFYLLSKALTVIPLGMGYAIWTGIGIVGTFIISVAFFHDPISLGQGLCVFLILAGIVGLRLL